VSERKALGIVGSPRRGANTETLVDEVLRGAEEAGATSEKLLLGELDIRPCRACNGCRGTNRCVIDDDFASALEKMGESGVWVLGTPVYWWGPTAQMKAFIDRWYSVERALFRGKRIVLTVSSGGGQSYSRLTVEMLEAIIPYLGMRHVATLKAAGTSGPDWVKRNTALLNEASAAGREAVKGL
jgi:multimeric flavodoxin WrbA